MKHTELSWTNYWVSVQPTNNVVKIISFQHLYTFISHGNSKACLVCFRFHLFYALVCYWHTLVPWYSTWCEHRYDCTKVISMFCRWVEQHTMRMHTILPSSLLLWCFNDLSSGLGVILVLHQTSLSINFKNSGCALAFLLHCISLW